MYLDHDFDLEAELPPHRAELTRDLALETILKAMAGEDPVLLDVARAALLTGLRTDLVTVAHRQAILRDALRNPDSVRELYALSIEAIDARKSGFWGILRSYPSGSLSSSVDLLKRLLGKLQALAAAAERNAPRFESAGFSSLFRTLRRELDPGYLARVGDHLRKLEFREGLLLSAELGPGNKGTGYGVRLAREDGPNWFERAVLGMGPPSYTFHVDERDEAGWRALSEMRDRGLNDIANAVTQAAEHVVGFFEMLRTELAFYVGCLNLNERLNALGASTCWPTAEPEGSPALHFRGLYDVGLALATGRLVVPNDADADGKRLTIITGANEGGKSTFLRSIGIAQLMMQSGMFVGAESFTGTLRTGLFTHYRREEDAALEKGKLDEELSRMSTIVDALSPDAMVLFNESFAATNEREGSEIARQVVAALMERRIRVVFVTHLYDFAHGFYQRGGDDILFLRAERRPDGTRSFRLKEGEPLETSYGEDVYRQVFSDASIPRRRGGP
jgi:hypothetical protein